MVQVTGVDHLVIRVSDYERSRAFYDRLFTFLNFEIIDRFTDMTGWRNGVTAFWIAAPNASTQRRGVREGDTGLHHLALEVRSRSEVDEVEVFLRANSVDIVDPAGEYYEDYYAVYFLDPDGVKIECMTFGPAYPHGARVKGTTDSTD
jgi:catechol 2,3-dioxygenase-like lactoylglutathione lyase family enzyme